MEQQTAKGVEEADGSADDRGSIRRQREQEGAEGAESRGSRGSSRPIDDDDDGHKEESANRKAV